jgi:uncharacterized protein DUF5818
MSQGSSTKGEKTHKVKGCIRSQGGSYVLEDAHGRTFALNSTEDLSAHVGHEVVIHGTESGASAGSSAASTGSAGAEKTITVSKVDHVSDTCKLGGGKHSKSSSNSGMGSSNSGMGSSSTGSSTGSTGSSTGSSTGTSGQGTSSTPPPPQK